MLRQRLLKDILEIWSEVASQPDQHPVMGTPPEDIVICEHPSADFGRAQCRGKGQPLQILDRLGRDKPVTPQAKLSEGRRQGAYWQHALARFHLAVDNKQAVLEVVFGPQFARGFIYSIVNKDGLDSIARSNIWVS
jgi:hypothetical protein